ncbi:hypothetical protein SCUP515_01383 [Seiridium cupressi]
MAEIPVVQILEKEKYFNQHIVSLPDAVPYPPLTAPSSLRIRTKVLSLTANNLSYAKLGFLLGWWDVHPLPSSTPAPLSDSAKFGRTNCWGFAEVLESTFQGISSGSFLWGYLPLGTLAQDVTVKETGVPGQIWITNEHRKNTMSVYNRYMVYPASLKEDIERKSDAVAMDASVKVMFETAFLLNRYAFSEIPENVVHPAMQASEPWGQAQADLTGATIIVLAPGAKAALAFAFELTHGRKAAKVHRVIGAASDHSKTFVEGTGLYGEVVSTSASPSDVLSGLRVGKDEKVMVIDFGARAGAGKKWFSEVQQTHSKTTIISIGAELPGSSQAEILKAVQEGGPGAVTPNASDMRERAISKVGEKQYFEGLNNEWEAFKEGGIRGFSFKWGEGMEGVKKGWDLLCAGNVASEQALVYKL